MPQPETIENIFAAYVNQDTLENSAIWMASNAKTDAAYRDELIEVLQDAERRGLLGDAALVDAVNLSGYQVADVAEAIDLVVELRSLLERALVKR
jgi:hypothetical protein